MPKSSSSGTVSSKVKPPLRRKPTYQTMISKAILQGLPTSSKSGTSAYAITKFIQANYPVIEGFKPRLSRALKNGVENGWLIQTKRSFRLSLKEKRRIMDERESQSDSEPEDIQEIEYRQRLHKRVKRKLSFDDISIP